MKCPECGKEVRQLLEYEPGRPMCDSCGEKYVRLNLVDLERNGVVERHGDNWRITEKGRMMSQDRWIVSDSQWYRDLMKGKEKVDYQKIFEGVTEEDAKATMLDLMKRFGAPPHIQFAFNKTGFIATDANWERLGRAKQDEWHQAIQEYYQLVYGDAFQEAERVPQAEQWVIVHKLENGETSVLGAFHDIAVFNYERAREFLSVTGKVGAIGYTPDGNYGSADLLGDKIIRIVSQEAVPRSDYDPRKHDTFHLRLGPVRKNQAVKLSLEAMQALGLLVDFERPGTAFDVMDSLYKVCQGSKAYDLLEILGQAHPIVWTPQMTMTAYHAVCELNEPLTVEADLIFINPVLWLYTVPCYQGCSAEHAVEPFTEDGHIPFPDELVGDLGAPIVAILFSLTDTEIVGWYFYLLERERPEIWSTRLKLGSQPAGFEQQTTLKWLRFAASPYLIVSLHHVERHVRRRVEDRFPQVTGGVGVILLRRAERIYESRGAGRLEGEVNWSCQWWVSGHWRHQWYPSSQSHKPVWIAPYIKGPPDKPLKEVVRLMVR